MLGRRATAAVSRSRPSHHHRPRASIPRQNGSRCPSKKKKVCGSRRRAFNLILAFCGSRAHAGWPIGTWLEPGGHELQPPRHAKHRSHTALLWHQCAAHDACSLCKTQRAITEGYPVMCRVMAECPKMQLARPAAQRTAHSTQHARMRTEREGGREEGRTKHDTHAPHTPFTSSTQSSCLPKRASTNIKALSNNSR